MHTPSQPKPRYFCAFSLVELLAVIGIITILLVAAVPVLSNSSNAARQASRELVKAHLQQARAHAISTGRPTALVIPERNTSDYGARALTLFEVQKAPTGGYKPAYEVDAAGNPTGADAPPIQRWETLPGNFAFIQASDINAGNGFSTVLDSAADLKSNFRSSINCHSIIFGSSGQIVAPMTGTPIRIAYAQTARRGNTLVVSQNNDGQPIFEMLEVNRLTGRTREVRP